MHISERLQNRAICITDMQTLDQSFNIKTGGR